MVGSKAVGDKAETLEQMKTFPGARMNGISLYGGPDRMAKGRHTSMNIQHQIELSFGIGDEKMRRYSELLRSMFAEQLAWIRARSHVRKIAE